MKQVIGFLVGLTAFASMANADWVCEAFCISASGARHFVEHGNHPVDVLNTIQRTCEAIPSRDGRIYSGDANHPATIDNACRQLNLSCN